jgi:long-chain fatty acid transport protein
MMSLIHLSKLRYPVAALLLLPGISLASGFALIEQSVSSMGTAYANGSSGMDDASTIFFNPASMSRLEGKNASGGLHVIHSRTDVDAKGFYNPSNPTIAFVGLSGVSTGNNGKDDIGLTAAVPHGGYSHQLNDRMWAGLTINGPFGLKTKYDNDWVGRYHAIKSDLKTVNINPSFAYEINDKASVGAGVSALYADGELTNAVDGGLATLQAGVPPGSPPFFWVPGSDALDSEAKLTGDDWGYGWNVGVMLEPTPGTRIGMHYRSKVDLTLEGDVRLNGPVVNFNNKAELEVTLPASASLSGLHALNPKWTVMADVTWTNWDKLDELRVKIKPSGNNVSPVKRSVTPLKWDNAIRVALGASYRHNDTWLFRSGVAYDETPVPKDSLRTPRVPDADRYWLTVGANYRYSEALTFDFGYAHLFVDDPEINTDSSFDSSAGQTNGFHKVKGDYDAAVDILSAQVNWNF